MVVAVFLNDLCAVRAALKRSGIEKLLIGRQNAPALEGLVRRRRETLQPLGLQTLEQVAGGSLTIPIKDTIVRPSDACGTPTATR